MKRLSILFLAYTLIINTSCNLKKEGSKTSNEELDLTSNTWVLDSWSKNDESYAFKTMESIQLTFVDSSKSINGNNGCNNFFASYSTDQNSLSVKAAGGTKKYCGEESSKDEQNFMDFLQSIPTYKIQSDQLLLETNTEKLLFNNQIK